MGRRFPLLLAVPIWILAAQACGDTPETSSASTGLDSTAAATTGQGGSTSGAGAGGSSGVGGASSSSAESSSTSSGVGSGFCDLPGSVVHTSDGVTTVPGAPAGTPDLAYLGLPSGFCAHYFGNIGNARQVRFASNGELFIASPTTLTTGGGPNGKSAIMILPDENHDGFADDAITYLANLPSTQGLLFANGHFYYQDSTQIRRVPYVPGDHAPSGPSELVADITLYTSALHWPKALDQADDGTIYVSNGGDQGEACDPTHPFHGGILALDGSPGGTPVAKGCRNPIAVRCQKGHNHCFASELARDYSGSAGGREKLIPIHQGDDWGFPCCASQNLPYSDIFPVPSCSGVTLDTDSFIIGETPFGVDFEPGQWPSPWKDSAFVTLHGAAGSWKGARIVAIAVDPTTGMPLPASNADAGPSSAMVDFATGYDDGSHAHGRPAAVTFSADGRMFVTNDTTGDILWISPVGM
jgi:glucose/arabinose dehydrogenase